MTVSGLTIKVTLLVYYHQRHHHYPDNIYAVSFSFFLVLVGGGFFVAVALILTIFSVTARWRHSTPSPSWRHRVLVWTESERVIFLFDFFERCQEDFKTKTEKEKERMLYLSEWLHWERWKGFLTTRTDRTTSTTWTDRTTSTTWTERTTSTTWTRLTEQGSQVKSSTSLFHLKGKRGCHTWITKQNKQNKNV